MKIHSKEFYKKKDLQMENLEIMASNLYFDLEATEEYQILDDMIHDLGRELATVALYGTPNFDVAEWNYNYNRLIEMMKEY